MLLTLTPASMNAPPVDPQSVIARMPIFQALTPTQCLAIADQTRQVRCARGDLLFRRGDVPAGLYVVVYGQIKLSCISPHGVEKVVDIAGHGQSFGEAVLFLDTSHRLDAQALTDSLLLLVPRDAVFARLDGDPQFARRLIGGMARRLYKLIADVEAYSTLSGTERVVAFLLSDGMGTQQGSARDVHLPVAKGVIASRLNLTQEHFSRILRELAEAGLIAVTGRHIRVPDTTALRQHVG